MTEEVELKLAVAPEHVERLRRHPILRALKQRQASIQRLVSVYYDTPAFELKRKAVALRVRKIGHERIQTIKREAAAGKGRLGRREWERRLESDRPDLSALEDPELRRLFAPHSAKGELKPVFVTDVERQIWPVRIGTSEIECALDVGEITADGKREPVCEVELELKSGTPSRLFELARRLNRAIPLRIEPASKAARGYSLASGTPALPRKAAPVELDPAMNVREAFAAITRACLAHIVANVDCAHEGQDPEGVHQLRVGIRRLRAAFAVFRDAIPEADRLALGGELRWLQQELGPAREWDVFVGGTLRALGKRLDGGEGMRALAEAAEAARASAYERARAALSDRRYTDLLLRLEGWLDVGLEPGASESGAEATPAEGELLARPIVDFAAEILRGRHAKALKFGAKIKKLDNERLHELRIRVKKLRYAIEFFRKLYADKSVRRYVAALKELQEALGTAHDALVAQALIPELEAAIQGPLAERAAGQLQGWCTAQLRHDRKRLGGLWQGFDKLKPFWKSA